MSIRYYIRQLDIVQIVKEIKKQTENETLAHTHIYNICAQLEIYWLFNWFDKMKEMLEGTQQSNEK